MVWSWVSRDDVCVLLGLAGSPALACQRETLFATLSLDFDCLTRLDWKCQANSIPLT